MPLVPAEFGVSKRGNRTLLYENCEFWAQRVNGRGETNWRCTKLRIFKCKAMVTTINDNIVGDQHPDHNHGGNVANALASKAVAKMKDHMEENIATPSASQGAVIVNLGAHVQMALPKRASLSSLTKTQTDQGSD